MGKVIWEGWQDLAEGTAQPLTGKNIRTPSLRQRLSFGASDEEQNELASCYPGDWVVTPKTRPRG